MHYVIGDIHNEAKKLNSILDQIRLKGEDELFLLGDIFDRGGEEADPVGTYFLLSGIQGKCHWIRGNHDQWLAEYIRNYFSASERKKSGVRSYSYNSFELMKLRLTEADMLYLADLIDALPLQKEIYVDGESYLLAHAMTSYPSIEEAKDYYLMGNWELDSFLLDGIEGYISLCGHTPTGNMIWKTDGMYLDDDKNSIWVNGKKNVFLIDCGSGFAGGRLACMCLETGERFYSKNV